jgi:alpha-mannosidase
VSKQGKGVSRRDFLLQGAATIGAVAVAPARGQQTVAGTRKVLHIIGHSHIDAAWLWPWRDGSDTVLNTFRSVLNRMNETPGFRYSHSSSAHYRWVEKAAPEMLAEIKQRIREGRWEVVGGWPVEPDCNIPAAESFVRHSLYGKRYCQRVLESDVKIGFNPDSFGHSAGLPTLLKRAGYGYYVFMRPQEHEMDLPLLFWWEGPDGSRVLTLRIWKNYDADANMVKPAATGAFAPGFDHGALFLGVGDHGGAVTKAQIKQILEMQKDPTLPQLRFSTIGAFFREVEESPAFASLPVIKKELQIHATGCYSAYGEGKYLNRRAERSLSESEVISLVANRTTGRPYTADQFGEAWWKVLFCQFHDMMAGTSLYSDYTDVRDSVGYACEVAQTEKVEALETMAKRVDLSAVEESAVFLFNPLPWKRKALVECYAEKDPSHRAWEPGTPNSDISHLSAKDGSKIALQWRPSESMTNFWQRLSAWVELPACGYKVFELKRGVPPSTDAYKNFFSVSDSVPGISSLKADGTELLAGPISLVAIRDASDTWAHGMKQFREELGRPKLVSSTVIEDGPVTRVTRQRAKWQDSEIVLDIAQFAGLDFIELRFVIDWREHEQMLKLEIPTALAQPRNFVKVPGAVIERTVNGNEVPYQDWGAVQGKIGGADYTMAVLNDSSYSCDCLDGLFRTVLIRSAPFARHNPATVPPNDNNAWQDQGRQERRFWIFGATGSYSQLALDRMAEELQTPAEFVMDSAHHGTEPWEHSYLEIMPANVWVMAVKQAESGSDATIIRIQERTGNTTQATLKCALLGLDHTVTLAPWEIKTLRVKPVPGSRGEVHEVSLMEV